MTFPFPVMRPTNWNVAASVSLAANDTGWGGFTVRSYVVAGALLYGATANRVRIRFVPPTSGNPLDIIAAYFGHAAAAGNAFDFAGDQVQLKFSGANTVSLAAGGASRLCDEFAYKVDKTKGLVVAMAMGATSDSRVLASGAGANFGYAYKAAVNDASTTVAAAYNNATGRFFAIDRIDVLV